MAASLGATEGVRRARGASIYRATQPAETTSQYYKRSVAIPFIDDVNQQLRERFPEETTSTIAALMRMIPAVLITIDKGKDEETLKSLAIYEEDLPRYQSLSTELQIYRGRFSDGEGEVPDTFAKALVPRTCFLISTPFFK